MKKVKVVLWVLFILFLALVYYQNQDYFLTRQSLEINFLIDGYTTPPIPNIMFILGSFIVGFLACSFFNLLARFQSITTIRELSEELETLKSHRDPADDTTVSGENSETGNQADPRQPVLENKKRT